MRRMMKNLALAAFWLIGTLAAQTRVDLQNQSKNVNLQAAPFTAPVQSGSALPATCSLADLFFETTAPAGSNLFGCTATNNWSLEASGSGGSLTIDSSGSPVGARPIMNFLPGTGIIDTLVDTGTQINVQLSADTAVMQSRAGLQSGQTLLCASTSGSSSTYTCAMTPTLTTYTNGMVLDWTPDVNGVSGATTLNVDTLGATSIKLSDGSSDPVVGDLVAGHLYQISFDGTVFRILRPTLITAIAGTQPTCSAALRGRFWAVFSASGTKDTVTVCAKDAADAYAWRTIY